MVQYNCNKDMEAVNMTERERRAMAHKKASQPQSVKNAKKVLGKIGWITLIAVVIIGLIFPQTWWMIGAYCLIGVIKDW